LYVEKTPPDLRGIRLLVICARFVSLRGMVLRFTKMNGAGNDFILIDNREGKVKLAPGQVVALCDRHRGIGADGIMLLTPCASNRADWAWEFYNSDGGTAEMCGNGARCFARFIQRIAGTEQETSFETGAGIIRATFQGAHVTVDLTEPCDLRLNEKLDLSSGAETIHSLNTGVPHAVLFVSDADRALVQGLGAEIRNHPHFAPRGTNVNFVQLIGPNEIRVRTYERGVEGETLACGTGVTASALITATLNGYESPVQVRVQSGEQLNVSFAISNGAFTQVRLSGPADFVFEGKIEI
jgi:diaminopimelate epimerase